ncbi:hypothetical protein [Empedobacter sp.]|uniref:hypothetical protein n=1 Tax=Empedobacter sp. TaxID=1927715 RepID=UPI00289EB278|nr:hypothetical protein [Empedobacter sp.]
MLIDFQKNNGLLPDGKLGEKTAKKMREVFKMSNIETAHFLGQGSVESDFFKLKRESGNYSVAGLRSTFSYYRDRPHEAFQDGRKVNEKILPIERQKTIFNKVYDDKNRRPGYKLGNVKIGDGWLFRGNAAGQTTGRYEHQELANHLKDQSIMTNPDIVWEKYYFEAFLFYLKSNNVFAKMKDITRKSCDAVTLAINGKAMMHADLRYERTQYFYKLLTK